MSTVTLNFSLCTGSRQGGGRGLQAQLGLSDKSVMGICEVRGEALVSLDDEVRLQTSSCKHRLSLWFCAGTSGPTGEILSL